jgi:hypothetical protein
VADAKTLEEALNDAFRKADNLAAPLDERLKFYLGESRKLLPDLESTYDELVVRIQANGADVLVPAVGDRLPDFLMTDSEGPAGRSCLAAEEWPGGDQLQPRTLVRLLRPRAARACAGLS